MTPKQRIALVHHLYGKTVSVADGLKYFGITDDPVTAATDISNDLFRCPSCNVWKIAMLEQEDGRCGVCSASEAASHTGCSTSYKHG